MTWAFILTNFRPKTEKNLAGRQFDLIQYKIKSTMSYGDYPDLTKVKKVLVVKHRHLGDVLLTTPVFTALKRALPQAEIDAYVYAESLPMLEGHPAISQLIGYTRPRGQPLFRRLYYEYKILRQIRSSNYDLVINLTEGDRGTLAAKISQAKVRVGFPPKGSWQKKVYTHLAKSCPSPRHTVERNLDALRRIGIFPTWEDRELFFHVPTQAAAAMHQEAPYILIHPTSRWLFKCWPVEKMRSLIEKLQHPVILTSGPDPEEKAMATAIAEGLPVLNLGGKISLKELGALVAQSKLVICVDSLPFHLANALKKPVVALFGPTSDVTWGPWRNPFAKIAAQNWSCRPCYLDGCGGSKQSDCLETLPVQLVLDLSTPFLENAQ
jgi:heptosyltransferase-3